KYRLILFRFGHKNSRPIRRRGTCLERLLPGLPGLPGRSGGPLGRAASLKTLAILASFCQNRDASTYSCIIRVNAISSAVVLNRRRESQICVVREPAVHTGP